jgi:hypothetical protein
MIILHGIPGGVLGRDGIPSFPYSQHDPSMDVPMEQRALAVVSYSLYTYRIEMKSISILPVQSMCLLTVVGVMSWTADSNPKQLSLAVLMIVSCFLS